MQQFWKLYKIISLKILSFSFYINTDKEKSTCYLDMFTKLIMVLILNIYNTNTINNTNIKQFSKSLITKI